jgi:hypothetical protein
MYIQPLKANMAAESSSASNFAFDDTLYPPILLPKPSVVIASSLAVYLPSSREQSF